MVPGGVAATMAEQRARGTVEDRIRLQPRTRPEPPTAPVVGIPIAGGLVRRRVQAMLDGVLAARICAVVAPAGSGKTTALAHWARSAPVDVAWWRADPVDHPAAVVTGVGHALHALAPQRPRPTTPASLVEAVQRHEGPLVLVVDDLHLVAGPGTDDVLEDLLLATDVHLVVASRTPLNVNLARAELSSFVVGAADLRFRVPETEELFRAVYAEPLDERDARLLTRRTDGWPAALRLFHHAVAGAGYQARHVGVREADAAYAREYVDQQVLAGLTPADLALLTRTSPLEVLNGTRCDALLHVEDSGRRLRGLARRGLLTAAGTEVRLGSVVRTHLQAVLRDELGEEDADDWYRACADRLEADGHPAAAVRAHVAGGHWSAARAVLARHADAVLADADLDWVAAAPVAPDDPWLRVARATWLVRDGRLPEAEALLAVEPAATDPDVVRRHAALRRTVRLWTAGDVQPGAAWYEQLRSTVRRPAPDRASRRRPAHDGPRCDTLLDAAELAVSGAVVAARRLLAGPLPAGPVAALAVRLLDAALALDDRAAEALADEAEAQGLPWFARVAAAIGGPLCAEAAVAEADARGDGWSALLVAGLGAVRQLRAGRADASAFEDLVLRCRALDAPALEAWARSGLALAAVAAELPDAVLDAESAVGFAHSAQVPGAALVAYAALGLADGRPELVRRAAEDADLIGLGGRPWEWHAPASRPGPRVEVRDRRAAVAVRCFGGFAISTAGEPVALNGVRPRARAVLRMLAVHAGQPVHRELLLDAMWPQLDVAAATHNLHVCVSSLRNALEPGVPRGASRLVVRDGERYLLALPEGSESDLRSFDGAVATAERARAAGDTGAAADALATALALYAGEVLPEDGPAEWVLGVRDRYRLRAAECAASLAELHLACARPEEAAAAAVRSIEIDPCRDASWRLLITAYDDAGNRAAAQRARRSYADVLASLGVVESTASILRGTRPGR